MRKLHFIFVVLGVLALVVLPAVSLNGQTASTSTVTGTVYDKSGATVPNAKVDLEDVDTKAKTLTTAANDGVYIFPSVRPGNYKIAPGTWTRTALEIVPGHRGGGRELLNFISYFSISGILTSNLHVLDVCKVLKANGIYRGDDWLCVCWYQL